MELFRALAVLVEPPTTEVSHLAAALELPGPPPAPTASEYTELFVFQLYPYASVYLGAEGMLGGEARDRIAGFWRALGQIPPTEADHLAVMLALYARLVELEGSESDPARRESWHSARKAFLWEHLLSWLPIYLGKLADLATPFYREWGAMLMRALLAEAEAIGKQEQLSLHLRESPTLIDPRSSDAREFLQSLLSPARSGMILVRSDLSRAARSLGLGLRLGERRFILQALFSQDVGGILDWLIEEAEAWAERHRLHLEALGETTRAWEQKAEAAATLLAELKLSATQSSIGCD